MTSHIQASQNVELGSHTASLTDPRCGRQLLPTPSPVEGICRDSNVAFTHRTLIKFASFMYGKGTEARDFALYRIILPMRRAPANEERKIVKTKKRSESSIHMRNGGGTGKPKNPLSRLLLYTNMTGPGLAALGFDETTHFPGFISASKNRGCCNTCTHTKH